MSTIQPTLFQEMKFIKDCFSPSRLSDQIMEKILQEVARETKLDSLVQNIYALELQEGKCFSGNHR